MPHDENQTVRLLKQLGLLVSQLKGKLTFTTSSALCSIRIDKPDGKGGFILAATYSGETMTAAVDRARRANIPKLFIDEKKPSGGALV